MPCSPLVTLYPSTAEQRAPAKLQPERRTCHKKSGATVSVCEGTHSNKRVLDTAYCKTQRCSRKRLRALCKTHRIMIMYCAILKTNWHLLLKASIALETTLCDNEWNTADCHHGTTMCGAVRIACTKQNSTCDLKDATTE